MVIRLGSSGYDIVVTTHQIDKAKIEDRRSIADDVGRGP